MLPIRPKTLFILIALLICSCYGYAQKLSTIYAIQGTKDVSPMMGQQVTVEGIVTANFQNEKSFAGFFIQESIVKSHNNGSSGIFVYESRNQVTVGDLIRLIGKVSEHNGVTQITNVQSIKILKNKQQLPKSISIDLPLKDLNLEKLEGMRVSLSQPAFITDHYNYIRYGEFTVSSKLLMNPTNRAKPGKKVNQIKQQNTNDRLLIDDGKFTQFSNYQQIDSKSPIYIGARVQVEGIMHFAFDQYRIELSQAPQFSQTPYPKQNKPKAIAGDVKIASFNLKNYFITLDSGKANCGPKKNFECRGADSNTELKRQQDKLVKAINTANADIFALQELENNKDSLNSLVKALNQDRQKNPWHYIKTGVLGEDVIRVGLIYQKDKITPVGDYKVLNPNVMPDFEADKNRDVLLQTFKDLNNNKFNITVLHLKSKRCTDATGTNKDQKDGQGCYNASRVKVAQQIKDWMQQDPTGQKALSSIILGDFNSYLKEEPITTFEKNNFSNLTNKFLPSINWTSIFRGEVGSIDHILANKTATKAAKGLTQWHINTIGFGWFDYNQENLFRSKIKPKTYYDTSPFSSSDHDIVIAGFTFSDLD